MEKDLEAETAHKLIQVMWDGGVLGTMLLSIFLAALLCLPWLFIWRRYFPKIYYPRNLENPKQRTVFGWIPDVLFESGVSLLKRTGMNGVLFCKWREYAIVILVIESICSIMLMIIYYYFGEESDTWFSLIIASSLENNSPFLWFTFATSVLLAILFLIIVYRHRTC